ncbi:MAG: hypothetical protein LH469_00640 [Frankiaceae bacterium]|nr:hypothetical protein [Frankiaceae bacterium]
MGVRLLGPARVDGDATLRPRDLRVLSALAVRLGLAVSAAELAEAVWGPAPPASWPKQVQICVGRLRKALGSAVVETVGNAYRLQADALDLDVTDFEQLVVRGRVLVQAEELDRAAATFARAGALWQGTPFRDLDGWSPALAERLRLEDLHRSLDEELLDARLRCGEHREVAGRAEALVAEDPLRERRWAILARAQYQCGRQADALRSLQRARRLLLEQLGVDPGRELVELEAAILRQEPALLSVPAQRAVSGDCPYKGLSWYDTGDRLYGRDREVDACLARLQSSPFLVLAGPSGCGKSSLLRAGIVPALHRLGRSTLLLVPGPDGGLDLPGRRDAELVPVLVVDQLEEVFAAAHGVEQVLTTCTRLAAHAREVGPVVVAVRADHLAGLAADSSLGQLVEQGLHLVRPLSAGALREAIERPATDAGLRIEEGLVDLLVRDTEGEPGALPLLSHALAETWLRRDGNVLTVEGYRATGGIRGAVSRSADRLYEGLPAEQRPVVRSLLLRLVAPSMDGDPVRCRVQADRLRGNSDRERVLALLIRSRLVTAQDEVVEISHEALARAWPRLRSWLDDDSAGQRVLRHLTVAADGWDALRRPDSELYRGARLATAVEHHRDGRADLTAVEQAFLDASMAHADSEQLGARVRAAYDARRNRRLRGLLAAVLALLLVSVVAGGTAVLENDKARGQRDAARAAEDTARLQSLVSTSLALRSTDRDVAALLAVEAARRWPGDPLPLSALLSTFTGSPGFLGYRYVADAGSLTGALVTGTPNAVISADGGSLEVLDLDTGRTRVIPDGGSSPRTFNRQVAVSADGRVAVVLRGLRDDGCFDLDRLRVTNGDGCATLDGFDVRTGARMLGPLIPPVGPGAVALSDDGALVAVAGGYDGALAVYRTADGSRVAVVPGLPRPPDAQQRLDSAGVAFGPDGSVYLGSLAGPVRVIDPVSGSVARTIAAPLGSSNQHVHVGADGVVVTGGPEWLFAADAPTGQRRWVQDLRGRHPDPCPFFAVAAAAGTVYCGNHFGQIEQRARSTGQRTGTVLDPQLGDVGPLATTDDGEQLVAFGAQVPAVSRWQLDGGGLVTRSIAKGHVLADGFDPADGTRLLVAARGPTATVDVDFDDWALWDASADREVDPVEVDMEGVGWAGRDTLVGLDRTTELFGWYDPRRRALVPGAEITPECGHLWSAAGGTRAYCGLLNGDVWTIDVATRQRIPPLIRASGPASTVSATRDGAVVVVTARGPDGPVTTVHDGVTGEQLTAPLEAAPERTGVSLDGVLVGASGGTLTRYDLMTGEVVAELPGARGEINTLQFSDDGRLLLATSNDQTASLYDVATGTRLGDPIPSDAPLLYPAYLRQDGLSLAVTDASGVQVWDLDPAHLREAACRLAGRNLTPTEWQTHMRNLVPYRRSCEGFGTS